MICMKREMKILLMTTLGTTIYGLGVILFLRPAGLYTGGIVGISRLLEDVFQLHGNFLGVLVFLINMT